MRIEILEEVNVKVCANKTFGGRVEAPLVEGDETIEVSQGEVYSFFAEPGKTWKDWFWPSTANGFSNPVLPWWMKRVRGVKCFCLCGVVGKLKSGGFAIGMKRENYTIEENGTLYFFPNDSFNHFDNNKGFMNLKVKRVR